MKIYAVKDEAMGVFARPMFLANHEVAGRVFAQEVNNKDSLMNSNPEHFSLFYLGEFNDTKGVFASIFPEHIADAKDVFVSGEVNEDIEELQKTVNKLSSMLEEIWATVPERPEMTN